MITSTDFLYKLKCSIEKENFKVGFMGFGGNMIICYNNKKKYTPKTISEIYNKYLKIINNNLDVNKKIIHEIHLIISNTLKSYSFSRSRSTIEYYKYLLYIIEFFIFHNLNKKITINCSLNLTSVLFLDYNNLLNKAEDEIKFKNNLNYNTIISLLHNAKRWKTLGTILQDAQLGAFNFAIPEKLTITQIENFNRSIYYRFVIDEYGTIIFGHGNNIFKETGEIMSYNGIKVASHAALNNYENVISAGKVYFDSHINKFTIINNYSVHYKSDANSIRLARILFFYHFPKHSKGLIMKVISFAK